MTSAAIAIAMVIEMLGALVQGVFGFGINLIAAPLLVFVDPHFAPVPVVCASLVGSGLVSIRERGLIDRRSVGWALGGRIPGTILGALVVIAVAGARLRPIVGLVVLGAVVLTTIGGKVIRTTGTLIGVGIISGLMNMIAGLGGAPFGLVCQDLPGPVLRPTLAVYVLIGGIMSGLTLLVLGKVGEESLWLTAILLPGVLAGFGLSGLLLSLADRKALARPGVLAIATVGAIAAIVRGPW